MTIYKMHMAPGNSSCYYFVQAYTRRGNTAQYDIGAVVFSGSADECRAYISNTMQAA